MKSNSSMPAITIVFGTILILMAVGSHFAFDSKSVTKYIPAFFGIPMALAGIIAMNPSLRKHAMHAAALVGSLGFLGGLGRGLPKLLSSEPTQPGNNASIMVWAMTITCGLFVAICVNSFIQARKARQAAS